MKQIVQDKRWEKFTESCISRKISEPLKTLTGLSNFQSYFVVN